MSMEDFMEQMYEVIEGIVMMNIQYIIERNIIEEMEKSFNASKIARTLDVETDFDGDKFEVSVGGINYMFFLNDGVKMQPMKWLVGKTIPFKKIGDKVIVVTNGEADFFRKITNETFDKPSQYNKTGKKFWHPGLEAKKFIQAGIDNSLDDVIEMFTEFKEMLGA